MKELLQQIANDWFFTDPLLFDVLCTHELSENPQLKVEMRVGGGVLEYNSELLKGRSQGYIAKRLRIEVVRILLRHPYQRQPLNSRSLCLAIASDMTIAEYYDANETMATRTMLKLPAHRSFEEYYSMVDALLPPQGIPSKESTTSKGGLDQGSSDGKKRGMNGGAGERSPEGGRGRGNARFHSEKKSEQEAVGTLPDSIHYSSDQQDARAIATASVSTSKVQYNALEHLQRRAEEWEELTALWKEDEVHNEAIEMLIKKAVKTDAWGALPRPIQQYLEQSMLVQVNIRRQLALFRMGILSNRVVLSRMKPSRRYGFRQMGIRHPYTTRVLVGIDVSGSIPDEDIQNFLSVINHFFTQGVERIDVVQFDSELHLPLVEMYRAHRGIKVMARGGTSFTPLISFFEEHPAYDGLIIFTDGCAPLPQIRTRRKVLWILSSLAAYKKFQGSPKLYIRA